MPQRDVQPVSEEPREQNVDPTPSQAVGWRQRRWLRREAIDLGDMVVQIIAVVVGILLALFINNWANQRHQRAAVSEAMHAIRMELSANRVALRAHAALMFNMATHMQESPKNQSQSPRPCYQWDQWRGIGELNLTDAAYQTSISTQALANMPFVQAQEVARVYGWQQYLQKGRDFDVEMLMQAHPLIFCIGIAEDIGREDLRLENRRYSALIGPDNARPPTLPLDDQSGRR
ncbi:MAG: hypothetical protein ABI247_08935 [Rhodanobacter sp.]